MVFLVVRSNTFSQGYGSVWLPVRPPLKMGNMIDFNKLLDAFNSIMDEVPSKWVIPMSCEERLHYDKHPPSEEELERLVRERGATEVTAHGIRSIRFPDKLMAIFKRLPEFQELQYLEFGKEEENKTG